MRRIVPLVVLLLATACGTRSLLDPPPRLSVGLGREFTLRVGQQAVQEGGGGVEVLFMNVSSDSRCPSDVVCVWSGNAVTVLKLAASGWPGATLELNTHVAPRAGSFAGLRVELLELQPYPRSTTAISPGAYEARLRLDTDPGNLP